MNTTIFNGSRFVEARKTGLIEKIKYLEEQSIKPSLTVISFSGDRPSASYIRMMNKFSKEIGVGLDVKVIDKSITQSDFEVIIQEMNNSTEITGIIVDMPLPGSLSVEWLRKNLSSAKDVDAITYARKGALFSASRISPSTASAVINILEYNNLVSAGDHVVVIGRSEIVGMPLTLLLLKKGMDATVTVCHSKTKNIADYTKNAKIVVSAAGSPEFLGKEELMENGIVIDVGISLVNENGKYIIKGDVRSSDLIGYSSFITPVPGGVGPVTTYALFNNLIELVRESK
ncbi:MAG: bifunctional 5,10-methylenetetrahydrofolate dehydrogenase/5,10-methenyltetrahydrofolate cyclohydrolase [Candidatus Thermoplasmatota archaeon]|jgi:methylenetetrahydrofolate dehydrogenase (NADP+)/methenyltetrahydrofolate cyclohydrolase|nr:bifunctional 5,10-methylenetetrahydrofolate dehydrogenase/5,10-methenyltetrahydrofolate cyclohydrolase [Candidatus Thermoplasmatota archaeon]MCL5963198.1 bifunctional 5,10-methylenetetrahydrofolate dehydrogenase/5,10-methenyltetrahydrofolate cyclohydrolase [Candidatus Thermoplasmatota archaeon]